MEAINETADVGIIVHRSSKKRCTACGKKDGRNIHPLLNVPVCDICFDFYHTGEFTTDEEGQNEIYCRWCGEGTGELLLCDTCPKSFCSGCIQRNLGNFELSRIQQLVNRWSCLICSPQIILDLSEKNGWNDWSSLKSCKAVTSKVIHPDISRGRARFEIPVINEEDNLPPPLDFVYVDKPVSGEGILLGNNPNALLCCSCTDNCNDATKCECAKLMDGFAYDNNGILIAEKPGGVYECNARCSCHVSRCSNRLVGRGPHHKLEVFRCKELLKGWGVRCTTDIPAGSYVADYVGEVIFETDAERRGLSLCDEYLFGLDYFSRSQACHQLSDLGMKMGLMAVPREVDMDVSTMDYEGVESVVGSDIADRLQRRGSILRAQALAVPNSPLNNGNDSNGQCRPCGRPPKKAKISPDPAVTANGGSNPHDKSWLQQRTEVRLRDWRRARSVITDRVMNATETEFETYTIDARWFGGVGRFLNHCCQPNLDIITVFAESHDVRAPRVAFFANEHIKANTELCYDYGYYAGNVEGKHRACLCGAEKCRKSMY